MEGQRQAWRYDLRPARPEDAAFVHAVRVAGLRPSVEPIWGWDEEVQAARFRESFDPTRYRIVVVDGREVGILALERRAGEVFVADIGIAAAWRNRGLGSAILRDVAAQAEEDGLPLALRVLRTNPARRLYERLGFRATGESDTHVFMRRDPARPRPARTAPPLDGATGLTDASASGTLPDRRRTRPRPGRTTMDPEAVVAYVTATFDGIEVVATSGDWFFFRDSGLPPDRRLPFATLVTGDRYDGVSNLDRPGVYRLNVGVGRETFRALVDPADEADAEPAGEHDFTALDRVLPHPVYGSMFWLCVLDPSAETFEYTVRPLLAEAYEVSARRQARSRPREEP